MDILQSARTNGTLKAHFRGFRIGSMDLELSAALVPPTWAPGEWYYLFFNDPLGFACVVYR